MGLVFSSTVAHADDAAPECEDPRVRIDGHPNERWNEAIARACIAIEGAPDSDPTSRVRLAPVGRDLIVEVALDDGRTAIRRVRDPAQLEATLDALLTLPPSPRRTEPPMPISSPPLPPPSLPTAIQARERMEPPVAPVPRVSVEIGLSTGGRIAGAQSYFSFAPAGYAGVRVDQWLIAIDARWDVLQVKSDLALSQFEMDTVGAGISFARRWHLGFVSVDAGVASRLLVETQSFQPEAAPEVTDAQTDLRLGAFGRVSFGHSWLRPFFAPDGEVSPGRLRRDIRIRTALPTLPSWSVGFAAGVAWGQP